ncbi:MAG: tetratricopeptide repeat protein [Holosporales bacterium]
MKKIISILSICFSLFVSPVAHAEKAQSLQEALTILKKQNLHRKALDLALIAARTGDADAQLWVGDLYRSGGEDLLADLNEARSWYLNSYRNGNPEAAHRLAMMALNAEGEPQDINKAQEWLARSFVMGNQGSELDYYKLASPSLAYAMELAQRGDAQAQTIIALAYQHGGSGIPVDHEKAKIWFEKAAAQGNTMALEYLQILSN